MMTHSTAIVGLGLFNVEPIINFSISFSLHHNIYMNTRTFLRDPGGLCMAGVSNFIMLAMLLSVQYSIFSWKSFYSISGICLGGLFLFLFAMCFWSHAMTMCTNPGFVVPTEADSISEEGEEEKMSASVVESLIDDKSLLVHCDLCDFYCPLRAQHCDICERCVILQDHHCIWVNNCIGIGNQKQFLLLLMYIFATSVIIIVCIGLKSQYDPNRLNVWILATSSLFAVFTICMLIMEIQSIRTDPQIAFFAEIFAKDHSVRIKSELERHFSVLCGTESLSLQWLFPIPPKWSEHEHRILYAYG